MKIREAERLTQSTDFVLAQKTSSNSDPLKNSAHKMISMQYKIYLLLCHFVKRFDIGINSNI